jgi:hypothetical protein
MFRSTVAEVRPVKVTAMVSPPCVAKPEEGLALLTWALVE